MQLCVIVLSTARYIPYVTTSLCDIHTCKYICTYCNATSGCLNKHPMRVFELHLSLYRSQTNLFPWRICLSFIFFFLHKYPLLNQQTFHLHRESVDFPINTKPYTVVVFRVAINYKADTS